VKATGSKKRPYVGLKGCTKKTLSFKSDFVFTDGTTSTRPRHRSAAKPLIEGL